MTFNHSLFFLTLLAASAIAQPNPAEHGDRSAHRDGGAPSAAVATNVGAAQEERASSTNKQRIVALLLRMTQATTARQTEALVAELARFDELSDQAFSIKGGAAIAGDDYYIMVNGPINRLLDGRNGREWVGKSRNDHEAIFIGDDRSRFAPHSIEQICKSWVFIFAREKVYYLNLERSTFGHYWREPWRNSR